jgi:carbamate kinase
VVPSPRPKRILELGVIELLIDQGINVICVGGGGIPVVRRGDGSLTGVEAVIDKDRASSLLACALKAEALLMLTDVDGVYRRWGEPEAQRLYHLSPDMMDEYEFAAGSMAPKVEAGFDYVEQTGGMAAIGALKDARLILRGAAGTRIAKEGGRG